MRILRLSTHFQSVSDSLYTLPDYLPFACGVSDVH